MCAARLDEKPPGKVKALRDMAEATHRHPFLLHLAAADLKQPENDWDFVLRRLRGLRGKDLQETVKDMIGEMCDDLAQRNLQLLELLQSLLCHRFTGRYCQIRNERIPGNPENMGVSRGVKGGTTSPSFHFFVPLAFQQISAVDV